MELKLTLEEDCNRCAGRTIIDHYFDDDNNWVPLEKSMECPKCKRTGSVPSPIGYELLEFLRNYF